MTQTANFTDLNHGITVMDAEYGTAGVAALYLMIEGDQVAIVETGTNDSVPLIEQVLTQKGLSFANVRYIMPTHVHLDHAGGAGKLMQVCPNAELVIHPFGAAHMIDPSRLEAGTIAVYGEESFRKLYGKIHPIPAERVLEAPDGFTVSLNGRELEFLDTPGHARHHFCIYDKRSNGIFTGDTFGLSYPQLETDIDRFCFVTTTPVQFDPDAMLNSIQRLLSYQPSQMYLTHFGAIEPTEQVVKQLTDSVEAFRNIALAAADISDNRVDYLHQKVEDYLLGELKKHHCKQTVAEQITVIRNDSQLNAQGLDVWLHRLAKQQQA